MRLSIIVVTVTASVPLLAAPLHGNVNKASNYMLAKKSVSLAPRKHEAPPDADIQELLERLREQRPDIPPALLQQLMDQVAGDANEPAPQAPGPDEVDQAMNPPQGQGQAPRPVNPNLTVPGGARPRDIEERAWDQTSEPLYWQIPFVSAAQ
ncbi:hypothetical protein FRB99_005653 [Tulasnella sp. 403]|nr:hypothetical protein FRB99_005653 [Tulasnella sp. 403]